MLVSSLGPALLSAAPPCLGVGYSGEGCRSGAGQLPEGRHVRPSGGRKVGGQVKSLTFLCLWGPIFVMPLSLFACLSMPPISPCPQTPPCSGGPPTSLGLLSFLS